MKLLTQFLCLAVFSLPLIAEENIRSEHAQKTLDIYTKIISMETSKGLGNVPAMANYLAGELKSAGFPSEDVEVVPLGETAVLIAKYRGDDSSGKGPIYGSGRSVRPWPERTSSHRCFLWRSGSLEYYFKTAGGPG